MVTLQATKNQTQTANMLRISFDQVNRVMYNAVERGLKRRSKRIVYRHVSIDEKAVRKGHDYISILSEETTGRVIGVVEGRSKTSVDNLCGQWLTAGQRAKVETLCTDMWDAYKYAAKTYFPSALLCHDHFHLVGYLNKAVDKVRRREVKKHEALKQTKYLFLKDQMNLTEQQRIRFESIKEANYAVSKAWRIKENFRDIQFRQTQTEAFLIYNRWRKDALQANIPEITKVVAMFDRNMKGIVNAIVTGSTNARAERLNGAIQELKVRGRGYNNTQNLINAIMFFHGNLNLHSHNSQ
ncbi:MAG: ISL3 family transposase [Flavisolibacter sp.]|nr:ISL3 family transposase [Flavisolibacter sp.]